MNFVLVLAAILCLSEAKPAFDPEIAHASVDVNLAVIGGSDASPGGWPWQLSQQRQSVTWSHSCGASLLSSNKALSAAHCVDGQTAGTVRVIAGQHSRSDYSGTQTAYLSRYVMHQQYQQGSASYANDIAILHLSSSISTGTTVGFATLPPDDSNNFAGDTCTVTGWGRTSSSNALPDILQQANTGILTTAECAARIGSIGTIWDNHICVYDSSQQIAVCNGDSGGPLNCNVGGTYEVAGVTSWVVSSSGNCLPSYPQVYTRTSKYLSWISNN